MRPVPLFPAPPSSDAEKLKWLIDRVTQICTASQVDSPVDVATATATATAAGYQPLDAELTAIAATVSAANKLPYFTGLGTAALADFTAAGRALVDDATADAQRTTLGVGTGDSPLFTAVNVGNVDTTVSRTGAGDIAIEGNAIYRAGGTDVPVLDGGTGASTAANARTNLGAAALGANSDITSLSALAAVNAGPIAGFRNRLINGCMRVNQRAAATNADDTYAHDRWNILTQTGTVACTTVQLIENGWRDALRITQSQAAAQRFGVEQIIEAANCQDLRGAQVTLAARVRISATTTLRYAILEWTGTADTVTSDFVLDWTNGTFTAGQFFTTTSTTVAGAGSTALTANTAATVSLTATISSSANNVAVIFWTDSTQAQNVTLDIGKVQLEVGAVATVFEVRPTGIERSICQRYYYQTDQGGVLNILGYGLAASTPTYVLRHPVPMRIAPTGTKVGTWNVVNCSQPSSPVCSIEMWNMLVTITASAMFQYYDGSGLYMTFNAEL